MSKFDIIVSVVVLLNMILMKEIRENFKLFVLINVEYYKLQMRKF